MANRSARSRRESQGALARLVPVAHRDMGKRYRRDMGEDRRRERPGDTCHDGAVERTLERGHDKTRRHDYKNKIGQPLDAWRVKDSGFAGTEAESHQHEQNNCLPRGYEESVHQWNYTIFIRPLPKVRP